MTIKSITSNSIDLLGANQPASAGGKAASPNVNYAGEQSLMQLTEKVDRVQTTPPDDLEPRTVSGFLDKVLTEQPLPEKPDTQRIALKMNFPKLADEMTVDDYKTTLLRAEYKLAGYGMLTDGQISQAEAALENKDLPRRWDGYDLANLQDAQKKGKQFYTERGMLERANRGGQAVLQYQQMKVAENLIDYKRARAYAPEALGGFIQPSYNAGANIGNSLTEPIRAGERLVFGTGYLPEIPRMTVAERSEYWNGNGRLTINKGAEIAATLYFGRGIGGKALATQPGRIGLGIESVYNVAAGIAGKDVTQTDKQGNSRQMPFWERGLRVAGGLLGANQVIKTEVALPNSLTNKAVNKLDDIFKNNTPKPQSELITPEGLRIKMNPIYRPIKEADNAVSEMRGRGGYESNEITTKGGIKSPRVKQPIDVMPSMKPNATNRPLGEAERVSAKANPENIRGLTRQNEAAETLSKNGYRVEQKPQLTDTDRMSNPWLKAEKKPDFKIEGEIFDAYTPRKSTSAKNVRDYIETKVEDAQTRRIVLNLDDSLIQLSDLKKMILDKPVVELEQILVVKNGKVENFFPFSN